VSRLNVTSNGTHSKMRCMSAEGLNKIRPALFTRTQSWLENTSILILGQQFHSRREAGILERF
jgi:hypothetical protein